MSQATAVTEQESAVNLVKMHWATIWSHDNDGEPEYLGKTRCACIQVNLGGNGVILNLATDGTIDNIHNHPTVQKITEITGMYAGYYTPVTGHLVKMGSKKHFVYQGVVYQLLE